MGNKFFVAFEKMQDMMELTEIICRMNAANARYEATDTEDAIEVVKVKLHDREGYVVKNAGNSVCFGLLWRKYFALSHDKKAGIYFFDKEYEQRKKDLTVIENSATTA